MDDEHTRHEIDDRVRGPLRPSTATARRIVDRALAAGEAPRAWGTQWVGYAALGTGLIAIAIGVWRWHEPVTTTAPSLSVVGRGSTVFIESADGGRWLVAPSGEHRASGN